MSEVELTLRRSNNVTVERVAAWASSLRLARRELVEVPENLTQLTTLTQLEFAENPLPRAPISRTLLKLTQIQVLNLTSTNLEDVSGVGCLSALTELFVGMNAIKSVPKEITQLRHLRLLSLYNNKISELPVGMGSLRQLSKLWLQLNRIRWLPADLAELSPSTHIYLQGNPLPNVPSYSPVHDEDLRFLLPAIMAATTALGTIREPALVICLGLEDLSLPALVTLEIVDAALPNIVPMHAKWDLITAVKHFHQRHGLERRIF